MLQWHLARSRELNAISEAVALEDFTVVAFQSARIEAQAPVQLENAAQAGRVPDLESVNHWH